MFIELTAAYGNNPTVFLSPRYISSICRYNDHTKVLLVAEYGDPWCVLETPEEIMQLIREARSMPIQGEKL